jgi:hypothetical protein
MMQGARTTTGEANIREADLGAKQIEPLEGLVGVIAPPTHGTSS